MRTHILGGGPAGLYLSILLKKSDPRREVHVFERNAPDDTFGWGVVFSDETLGNLEDADRESFRAITQAFAYWDSLDIHYRGTCIRSRGHGFCGMSRKRLLGILQARARELGVEITFRHDVEDPAKIREGCDLFVGADGVNSRTRALYADVLRPTIDRRKCRYMWLGSDKRLPAFTFSFRENEHGVFQIHAYQFEEGASTVIVECDEESWKNAGLDAASTAESIAYCERVFAEDLAGHHLLDNASRWIQFPTISLERWHFDDVVLIGDAAHTAHFSIGSGTKLAMEDSIALAAAIDGHADLGRALAAYEADRREWVGRTQKAAQQSLEWFEEVRRHVVHEPLPFAFSLLTRSRRITHENLRLRDPALVEAADRWFLARAGQPAPAEGERPSTPMFTPFSLRSMTVKNRVVVSPMCQYSAIDGVPNDWHLVHLGSRAMGGAGLVFTEMTDVSADGRISPGCAGLWSETQRDAWRRVVDFVHGNTTAKIAMQLAHAGRKGSTRRPWEGEDEPLEHGNWPLIAPSAIAYKPGSQVPRAMTREDMERVRDDFVRSTRYAAEAGFDLLELHMAHGYLLSTFLSPLTNVRDDDYGGSRERRMRFPLEVFEAVRAVWPSERPMSVRISATDWVEGGFDAADAVALSQALKERGCDLIDVSTGQVHPDQRPNYGRCYQTPFAERIRNEVGIPTLTVGAITDADQINTILLAGRADLCALARPHLFDPYFTLHAAAELGQRDVDYPPQYLAGRPRR
ncbi:MAG: bifunctional salicylyl-CoA 5-hydroxylase/oxidoreductase [Sandaracinaceae bacterium]|nr:bifunctional salicylyl-CoA 5-hydroxylase/oxidoreductase [Sandaracinaceae bacterium]